MGWIYHEKQVSALCGQHCLNNLLQSPVFSPDGLAQLALRLDAQERAFMLSQGTDTPDALKFLAEDSGNVDEAGNFSLQARK
jgi:Ataxin-3